MSDLGFNIWGVITSTLGLSALLPFAWLYTQLPSRQLRSLERFMYETEKMFRKGLEDGFHTQKEDLYRFHSSIWAINIRIDDFRQTVRALSGWRAEVKAWWGGLSGMIADLRQDVDELRTELIDSSSRDRKRLAAAGFAGMLAIYSGAQGQERRSTILSYASRDDNLASSTSDATVFPSPDDGQHPFAPRSDEEQHPLAPRTESPSPILERGASRSASPVPHSPAHPPVVEDQPSVANAAAYDLALIIIDALHARLGEPMRGRRVERRDVLHRFGRQLLAPAPAAHPYLTSDPSGQNGDARNRLKSLSGVLPSYYEPDVVVLQGDGGVVHIYLGPFATVSNGTAYNGEYDGDDENEPE